MLDLFSIHMLVVKISKTETFIGILFLGKDGRL
jgi:hypothetical protein